MSLALYSSGSARFRGYEMTRATDVMLVVLEDVVHKDAYDQLVFSDIVDHSGELQSLVGDDPEHDSGCSNRQTAASDVFSTLYKIDPQVVDEAPKAQRKIMESMMGLQEYQDARDSTQMDDVASALGTIQLAPSVLQAVEKMVEYEQQKMDSQSGEKDPGGKGGKQSVERAKEMSQESEDEHGVPASIRQSLRNALKQAQEDADQWSDCAAGWGMGEGELQNTPFKEKIRLAKDLTENKKFKKIAELAGRFKNIVNSVDATVHSRGADEIVDITSGSDIFRALPTELLKFKRNPTLFMKDLAEENLLCYNLKGVEKLGHGPIIMCVDMSGSMQGSREIWAKAVALALITLAEKQKRAFGFIGFDSKVSYAKFFAKGHKVKMSEKIEIASFFSGGGTNFRHPLEKAFEMRELEKEQLNPADIVFITDGDCRIDEQYIHDLVARKNKTQVRIHGIAIETRGVQDLIKNTAAVG